MGALYFLRNILFSSLVMLFLVPSSFAGWQMIVQNDVNSEVAPSTRDQDDGEPYSDEENENLPGVIRDEYFNPDELEDSDEYGDEGSYCS